MLRKQGGQCNRGRARNLRNLAFDRLMYRWCMLCSSMLFFKNVKCTAIVALLTALK